MHLIEEAESRKAPIERFELEILAAVHTTDDGCCTDGYRTVPLLFGESWDTWIYRRACFIADC